MKIQETKLTISENNELLPIEIQAKEYFMDLCPWKDGKLATVDGWGRFSEISFLPRDRYKITPLVNFPKMQMDKDLTVWPEANLFFSHAGKMMYIADMKNKKTKDFLPLLTWVYTEDVPVLLDGDEGLVVFQYREVDEGTYRNVYYNYKTDEKWEDLEESKIQFLALFENDLLLAYTPAIGTTIRKYFFYNWRTKEIQTNKLTDTMTVLGLSPSSRETFEFIIKPRIMTDTTKDGKLKLTWNEDYTKVETLPLNYLAPDGKRLSSFYFSLDGKWATVYLDGYKGLYDEALSRRVFFHLDERYPGGISMPIFADGYEKNVWMYGSFFEHPEYGPCYAHEYYKEDKQYMRLYKMSDVVTLINQKLLEKANDIVKR